MFRSLKLYQTQVINLDEVFATLLEFNYHRRESVTSEAEFARRGNIVDIFPVTFEYPIRIELDDSRIAFIKSFSIIDGKPLWEHQMVIVLPTRYAKPSKTQEFSEEIPINSFVDLRPGDFVVHVQHGIGIYRGMKKLIANKGYRDHLVIEYAGSDKLYVPTDHMYLVQKYIGFKTRPPKIHKLDTKEWQAVKNRARKGIENLAVELLQLQIQRQTGKGISYGKDTDWQMEFEKRFPYTETPDQLKATLDVKRDMESGRIMDRLLCGDVGYGKTEVAMRAAFKAVMDNKQVAILVPTTILAEQHYQNFVDRTADFPVNIESLSRFKSNGEQSDIINRLAKGKIDIVIGTHRLLSDDVKFKDLGLLIIDEEQRFGVLAKEKLKQLKRNVDVLTLTATPIPRTLYMSLMSIKDMSAINTPPKNRMPVETHVAEFDDDLVRQAILKEINRKGQVYVVHNHILDIEKLKERIEKNLPKTIKIGMAHGQMNSHELEYVMSNFMKGNISVFISTNIIESGIDVPLANTLIVNNAYDFGLADLHQLRGRVGRFDRKAFAYFLIPKNMNVSSPMRKRLEAIQQYSELGSGFKIAIEDLEIRGAGNLLGVEQHGFIMAVGFDLYCRMLREAVSHLKTIKELHTHQNN